MTQKTITQRLQSRMSKRRALIARLERDHSQFALKIAGLSYLPALVKSYKAQLQEHRDFISLLNADQKLDKDCMKAIHQASRLLLEGQEIVVAQAVELAVLKLSLAIKG